MYGSDVGLWSYRNTIKDKYSCMPNNKSQHFNKILKDHNSDVINCNCKTKTNVLLKIEGQTETIVNKATI